MPAAEAPPKPAAKVSAPSVAAHPQKQEPLAEKSEALEVAAVPPTAKSSVVQAPEVVTVKADEAPLISADAPPPISAALPAEPAHVDKPVVPAPVAPPAEAKVVAVASAPAASAAIAGLPVRSLEDTVSELLRPMLREWLDKNMPRIVESALRVEMAGLHKPVEKKPTTV